MNGYIDPVRRNLNLSIDPSMLRKQIEEVTSGK